MKENFTTEDLKDGMVVVCRNHSEFIVYKGNLYAEGMTGNLLLIRSLSSYENDLTHNVYEELAIMKVYYNRELLWERKEKKEIKLFDSERSWLTVAKHEGKRYIARDMDGEIYVYKERPNKCRTCWSPSSCNNRRKIWSEQLFKFISWSDDEPYLIEDLLKL